MFTFGFYHSVWKELEGAQSGLRAVCKVHLDRLRRSEPGVRSIIRIEKITKKIIELKITWEKQEWRFLYFIGPNRVIYVVSFFSKKTRKTPLEEIRKAEGRMREIELDQATVYFGSLQ